MSIDVSPSELAQHAYLPGVHLSRRTLAIMAFACGASAANIYYNFPLLSRFAAHFHATDTQAGLVATAASVGYGLGILLFVPLGDIVNPRRVVMLLVYACVLMLVGAGLSPNLTWLVFFQFLVGITAMSPQLLIPLAVDLTPPEERGRTVGILMGGLLCGLLLARTISGFIADYCPGGWRTVFFFAAGVMLVLAMILRTSLPNRPPLLKVSYPRLMHSLLEIIERHPPLWSAGFISGATFGVFQAFWTCLSFLMETKFHRGATEAGLFGIIGLGGALCAPLAGKLSDKRGPAFTVTLSLGLTLAAFLLMGGWVTIASLVVGVLLMDLGVQSIQVAKQAKVIALDPAARSRINTLYMVCRFTGGAMGSWLGALAWAHHGWTGVCAGAVGVLLISLAVHLVSTRGEARKALAQLSPGSPGLAP
jgi:predicted MFS family arabinose efflux permease